LITPCLITATLGFAILAIGGEAAAKVPNRGNPGRKRSLARLAAVQALYQMELTESGRSAGAIDAVLREFIDHRFASPHEGEEAEALFREVDRGYFAEIVKGVTSRIEDLDGMITPALPADWPLARLETVLRAVLRAGTWELLARPDTPPRVIISEYIEIAHAFFSGKEPGMVNGILDRLARLLRPEVSRPDTSKPADEG